MNHAAAATIILPWPEGSELSRLIESLPWRRVSNETTSKDTTNKCNIPSKYVSLGSDENDGWIVPWHSRPLARTHTVHPLLNF